MIRSSLGIFQTTGLESAHKKFKGEGKGLINNLPDEMLKEIFSKLGTKEICGLLLVNKKWLDIGMEIINNNYNNAFFDLAKWASFLGTEKPSDEEFEMASALLPENIKQIIKQPCPIYPDKLILETHRLIYLKSPISGKEIDLKTLGQALEKHLAPNEPIYNCSQLSWESMTEKVKLPSDEPQWVLMMREMIPESFGKDSKDQKLILDKLGFNMGLNYRFPKTIVAVACMVAELLENKELPFYQSTTRCEETLDHQNIIVGNMENTPMLPQSSPEGIYLNFNSTDAIKHVGVAPAVGLSQ